MRTALSLLCDAYTQYSIGFDKITTLRVGFTRVGNVEKCALYNPSFLPIATHFAINDDAADNEPDNAEYAKDDHQRRPDALDNSQRTVDRYRTKQDADAGILELLHQTSRAVAHFGHRLSHASVSLAIT